MLSRTFCKLPVSWSAVVLLISLCGCGPKETRFHIVDYRQPGESQGYFQGFSDCTYCTDAHGNIDIVARHTTINQDAEPTIQVVHMRTFWIPQPGRTSAERSMINATVSYLIVNGKIGATFEGSGFLSFRENRKNEQIKGRLELSSLKPQRRLGNAERLFEKAELSGEFVATRDKASVLATLREMRNLFGPMPEYDLSTHNPNVH